MISWSAENAIFKLVIRFQTREASKKRDYSRFASKLFITRIIFGTYGIDNFFDEVFDECLTIWRIFWRMSRFLLTYNLLKPLHCNLCDRSTLDLVCYLKITKPCRKYGRKSSNLVKNHELICRLIILYLVPLPALFKTQHGELRIWSELFVFCLVPTEQFVSFKKSIYPFCFWCQ